MSSDTSFRVFVLDQLRGIEALACRPMFGGHGLYQGKTFFGILFKGRLYFKTDEESRRDYAGHGMTPFRPSATQTLKRYYEVPVDVLEQPDQLVAWARRAVQCRASAAAPRARHR